jgi:DNA-directed RNA polymerase subunit RPC12/RpoP
MTEPPRKSLEQLRQEAQAKEGQGLACPSCGWTCLPALYTRRVGQTMLRVRVCRRCGTKVLCKEAAIGPIAPRKKRGK